MTATHDAIAEAIRAHVAAEADGAYLTDWVLVAAGAVPAEANSTIYVTTTMPDDPLDAIDADLLHACEERQHAWARLCYKDSSKHRAEYDAAQAQVDALLDMRSGMTVPA